MEGERNPYAPPSVREFKDPTEEFKIPEKRSEKKNFLIFGFLLFMIVLLIGLLYFFLKPYAEKISPHIPELQVTEKRTDYNDSPFKVSKDEGAVECILKEEEKYVPEISAEISYKEELKIDKEDELTYLRLLTEENYLQGLADTAKKIITFKIDQNSNKVAYLAEEPDGTSRAVYLYDLKEKTNKKIHEMKTLLNEQEGYTLEIKDINFSPDGKLIAITTSTGLYTYNVQTDSLKEIFNNPQKVENSMTGYGFYFPKFSQNNRYVLYSEQEYEGTIGLLYDLISNVKLDSKFSYYIDGQNPQGWYDNKLVYEFYSYEEEESIKNGIYLWDPLNKTEELFMKLGNKDSERIDNSYLIGNKLFYIESFSEDVNKYLCDKEFGKYPVYKKYYEIYSLNLDTKDTKNITKIDAEYFDGSDTYPVYPFLDKITMNNKEYLLIKLTYPKDKFYAIDDNNEIFKILQATD